MKKDFGYISLIWYMPIVTPIVVVFYLLPVCICSIVTCYLMP